MSNLYSFDESKINWNPMPNVEHAWISILDIDDTAKIVDIILKFSANEKIVLHKHRSAFNTFVVKGEHRLYGIDGELAEIRPAGTYTVGSADADPHQEGGGDEDVIILFSLRPYDDGLIYEILDKNQEVELAVGFNDFKEMKELFESTG
ncbi:MAG: regulator [Gammaproteobacteria bacterium]|nr:regulator [Gammaproteobacteria bacterium]|tara:strand:- start:624 stop:1070 length:447 start_codon:yes stop_codon:yes gene_type:complete